MAIKTVVALGAVLAIRVVSAVQSARSAARCTALWGVWGARWADYSAGDSSSLKIVGNMPKQPSTL
jgi:hypothetical protein